MNTEQQEQHDLDILTGIRKRYTVDGQFRHARELAEVLDRPLGQVQGALDRLRIAGEIEARGGSRPRYSGSRLLGRWLVTEYAPTRDQLRLTIRCLEVACELAGLAATADVSTDEFNLTAANEVAGDRYSRSGDSDDWGSVRYEVRHRVGGFEVRNTTPGHRIELDPFLEDGAN